MILEVSGGKNWQIPMPEPGRWGWVGAMGVIGVIGVVNDASCGAPA